MLKMTLWALLSSSERQRPEAAWRPVRTWARPGCFSGGRTSRRAGAGTAPAWRRWDKGTILPDPGGGSRPRWMAAWGTDGGCGPGTGGSTVEPCRTAGRARCPTAPCGPASRPLEEPSERCAPAYAAWLFCSETTPETETTRRLPVSPARDAFILKTLPETCTGPTCMRASLSLVMRASSSL